MKSTILITLLIASCLMMLRCATVAHAQDQASLGRKQLAGSGPAAAASADNDEENEGYGNYGRDTPSSPRSHRSFDGSARPDRRHRYQPSRA
uniref:Secreted protein n=1 Tax=Kalanchoe fedtschenkoi TaxID=63787 RepID=A0A7N0T2F2_KALFE